VSGKARCGICRYDNAAHIGPYQRSNPPAGKGDQTTKIIQLKSHIKADGLLGLYVLTSMQESDVEVVIVVQPIRSAVEKEPPEARGWPPEFFESTAGCLADDPIQRWPQDPRVNDGR
jgi:hypothetical protein